MFEIGEKVICVDSSLQPHTAKELAKDVPNWVKKGEKYTIREFKENDGIVLGILLEEVVNKPIYFKLLGRVQEPAFGTFRFRKLHLNEVESEVESMEEILQTIN